MSNVVYTGVAYRNAGRASSHRTFAGDPQPVIYSFPWSHRRALQVDPQVWEESHSSTMTTSFRHRG